MAKGFVASILSTQKRRQQFYYVRNITSLFSGIAFGQYIGGGIGFFFGVIAIVVAYMTIAPIIALLVCLIEQMYS